MQCILPSSHRMSVFRLLLSLCPKMGNNGNTNKFLDIRCNVSKLIVKTSYPISFGFIAPLCTCKLFPYMKITDNLDEIYQNITMLHLRSVGSCFVTIIDKYTI